MLSGPFKEVENITQAVHDTADFIDNSLGSGDAIDDTKDYDFVPDFLTPETGLGETAQALSAFAAGWVTGGKLISLGGKGLKSVGAISKLAEATKASKPARYVSTALKGGVIDFVSGDGSDQRLADAIVNNDLLGSSIAQYLASNEDDSLFEGRLKNVAEGFILGGVVDSVIMPTFRGIKKGFKASAKGDLKASLAAHKETAEALDNTVKNPLKTTTETVEATAAETATKTAATVDEAIAKAGTSWAEPSADTYTARAVAQQNKQRIRERNLVFNSTHYQERIKGTLEVMDEALDVATSNSHMNMAEEYGKALDHYYANNLDKTFDPKAVLFTDGLKDMDKRVGTAVHGIWLNVAAPDFLRPDMQKLTEGVPNATETIREKLTGIFDVLLDLKLSNMEAGQISAINDAIRRFSGMNRAQVSAKASKAAAPVIMGNAESLGRQLIQNKTDEELAQLASTFIRVMDNGDGKVMDKLIAAAVDNDDKVLKVFGIPKDEIIDSIYKYRYISMLSSMKTSLRNFTGNSAKIPLIAFEESVQGAALGWQATDGGFAKKAVGAFAGAKDGAYFLKGLNYAKYQAWETLKNSWKYGEALTRPSEYSAIKKTKSWGVFDWPLKALQAADEFFASLTGTAKAYEQAMIDLKASGALNGITDAKLRGEITAKWFEDYMPKTYLKQTMADGTVLERAGLALTGAREIADEATFQQALDQYNKRIADTIQRVPGGRLLFPFYKTPVNIFKDVFWTRGAKAPYELYTAMNSGDPQQIAKAVSHVTSAIFLWTTAYSLVQSGHITGKGPDNPFQRESLEQTGWKANSYRDADGNYYSLDAIEPYGSMLGFLASSVEQADRDGASLFSVEGLDYLWQGLLTTAKDKTFLKGLGDIMQSIDRGTTTDSRGVPSQIAISFIPSLLRDLGQAIDPIRRQTPDFYSKALNRTPWRDVLAPQVNWVTGTVQQYGHGGGAPSFFDAWSGSKDNGNAVFYELTRLSGVDNPNDEILGVKLTPEEYAEYKQTIGTVEIDGRTLYQTLDEIINSSNYQRDVEMNPDPSPYELADNRAKILQDVIRKYKERGKADFLRANPRITQESNKTNPLLMLTEA